MGNWPGDAVLILMKWTSVSHFLGLGRQDVKEVVHFHILQWSSVLTLPVSLSQLHTNPLVSCRAERRCQRPVGLDKSSWMAAAPRSGRNICGQSIVVLQLVTIMS
jgi:hypothetical protein